ncbi:MAG: anaerobic carbon-monoxide dehydrogenase catalytic subunit [Crenarchaeota archaeon]|nr:anaerobic carbon-monoxide dehydrogenase catalytic subunit [Thermoproteota archaeon]
MSNIDPSKATIDRVTRELLEKALQDGVETIWHRFSSQEPQCGFGLLGICCRHCLIGPCRIDPFGEGASRGSCGVDSDTIVARGLLRHVCAGASSYTDLTMDLLDYAYAVAEGKCRDLSIADRARLEELAKLLDIDPQGKDDVKLATEVVEEISRDMGSMIRSKIFEKNVPKEIREIFTGLGLRFRGVLREIVESLHKTHEGVSTDPEDLLLHSLKIGLYALWVSAYLAYALQDVLSGTPSPRKGPMGPRAISEDYVNIVVRIAKRPLLKKLVEIAKSKEMEQEAINVNALGVNVLVPANFMMSEVVLSTGMVELFVVDYLCTMQGIVDACKRYHTKLVTTSHIGRIRGAEHVEVTPENMTDALKKIVKMAIENFKNRKEEKMFTPRTPPEQAMIGWSIEALKSYLKGSLEPLANALKDGTIRGVAIVFGCTTPKVVHNYGHAEVTKGLIKNNILVLGTGCWNVAAGLAGLLKPEARQLAGEGLSKFCAEYNIPPCLSFGGCADNARIMRLLVELSDILKVPFNKMPIVASAPEPMAEEIMALMFGMAASGVVVHSGVRLPILGSKFVKEWLEEKLDKLTGGKLFIEVEPSKAVKVLSEAIEEKRRRLGWS